MAGPDRRIELSEGEEFTGYTIEGGWGAGGWGCST
jgi:hypothetical protein